MIRRPFTATEIAEVLRLYRDERLSYQAIAQRLGRNHSSIGYLIRREDLREEERLLAEEAVQDQQAAPLGKGQTRWA